MPEEDSIGGAFSRSNDEMDVQLFVKCKTEHARGRNFYHAN